MIKLNVHLSLQLYDLEFQTLARVIGTVAKFSKLEMDNVITREESRVAGWMGGAVSHALSGR
ncbi:hypothetical protein DICVIV_03562 [Dictyocaulus viviparus]|uniref:Uncharacterized protein n=1 Tax=Dictyocaulus viviparus TaxID=29172 RepID=A0A0D8Y2P1_DICVI|nr:hypothetical protein DICVIV_03562 [Dictyocaulus viviparus]